MYVWDFLSQRSWKISILSLKVSDEDEILPPKLQAALMQILEERDEILAQEQNFSQGRRRMIRGLKAKGVVTHWMPSALLKDAQKYEGAYGVEGL